MGARGFARLVPAELSDDRIDGVGAQPVDEPLLALALLCAADRLDGCSYDLAGCVCVRLVLRRRVAKDLRVLLDELDIGGVAGGERRSGRSEDALGLVADGCRELWVRRSRRERRELRLLVELLQRDDQVNGILVLGAAHQDVGVGARDLRRDSGEVRRVRRIDLVGDGLYAGSLELFF